MMNFDYFLQIHGAVKGGMLYLGDKMSEYRYRSVGSWTTRKVPLEQRLMFHTKKQEALRKLNDETNGKYDCIITQRLNEIEFLKLKIQKKFGSILKQPILSIYSAFPLKRKVSIFLECCMPWTLKIRRMLINGRKRKI